LSNLREILNIYELNKNSKKICKKVQIYNKINFRQSLSECTNQTFEFNHIADPAESLLYILDILNKSYKQQIHNNFYFNLIAQNNCVKKCKSSMKVRFDKNNFSYHIYTTELLNYIKSKKKVSKKSGKIYSRFLSNHIKMKLIFMISVLYLMKNI